MHLETKKPPGPASYYDCNTDSALCYTTTTCRFHYICQVGHYYSSHIRRMNIRVKSEGLLLLIWEVVGWNHSSVPDIFSFFVAFFTSRHGCYYIVIVRLGIRFYNFYDKSSLNFSHFLKYLSWAIYNSYLDKVVLVKIQVIFRLFLKLCHECFPHIL
jgi:hypothetical protein